MMPPLEHVSKNYILMLRTNANKHISDDPVNTKARYEIIMITYAIQKSCVRDPH